MFDRVFNEISLSFLGFTVINNLIDWQELDLAVDLQVELPYGFLLFVVLVGLPDPEMFQFGVVGTLVLVFNKFGVWGGR